MAFPLRNIAVGGRPGAGTARSVYREFLPPSGLRSAVACTWEGLPGWAPRSLRLLPDGCTDLVWDGDRLLVVGPVTTAVRRQLGHGLRVGLRLACGSAGGILGVPMRQVPAEGLALESLWGLPVRCVEGELARAPDGRQRRGILQRLVGCRIEAGDRPDLLAVAGARRLATGASVAAVAAATGVSTRELHRRCDIHVGYGPKALHRVLRLHRLVPLLRVAAAGEASLAGLAVTVGYADQAHMTRECVAITGWTPARLAAALR